MFLQGWGFNSYLHMCVKSAYSTCAMGFSVLYSAFLPCFKDISTWAKSLVSHWHHQEWRRHYFLFHALSYDFQTSCFCSDHCTKTVVKCTSVSIYSSLCTCAGRATKRKADVIADAEPLTKQDKGNSEQEDDVGQRVIIEHWSVCNTKVNHWFCYKLKFWITEIFQHC